ncbi:hypothetical protein H310_12328 [Aphanomyces invadans]|uniref:Uncharacterized protein n=1 Tax=Aphanomyces invadans TaxID=157072 RepID=A0A024TK82_9STRA|nr:hypothetical protein H310_12328 [Aphanomyces invadans]ETV93762.1 hypothetical protein H310_12328 [Aphanomyces invadans]|eukprot:XP_008877571.1 hypothetical protein H310_12328 [Aphanomyces invadans]
MALCCFLGLACVRRDLQLPHQCVSKTREHTSLRNDWTRGRPSKRCQKERWATFPRRLPAVHLGATSIAFSHALPHPCRAIWEHDQRFEKVEFLRTGRPCLSVYNRQRRQRLGELGMEL